MTMYISSFRNIFKTLCGDIHVAGTVLMMIIYLTMMLLLLPLLTPCSLCSKFIVSDPFDVDSLIPRLNSLANSQSW